MKAKHARTLEAIFRIPTGAGVIFTEIEALIVALGGSVEEREGSRVLICLGNERWRCHRPHPGKDGRKYQVEEARELLTRAGVKP